MPQHTAVFQGGRVKDACIQVGGLPTWGLAMGVALTQHGLPQWSLPKESHGGPKPIVVGTTNGRGEGQLRVLLLCHQQPLPIHSHWRLIGCVSTESAPNSAAVSAEEVLGSGLRH